MYVFVMYYKYAVCQYFKCIIRCMYLCILIGLPRSVNWADK